MSSELPFSASERQIDRFASRVFRRLRAAGNLTISLEDVKQELVCAWCVARDRFEPGCGVPFAAYLARGMMNHINRWADAELKEYWSSALEDVDGQVRQGKLEIDGGSANGYLLDGDGVSLHDAIADQGDNPEELAILADRRKRVMSRVSDMTATFLSLLENPPAFMVEELRALQARAVYARERGFTSNAPSAITSSMVMDFLGLDRFGRTNVYREVKGLSEGVNQK